MYSRLYLLAAAPLVIAQPVYAKVYLSVEQAQQQMFPGQQMTPAFRTLSDQQVAAIEAASGANVLNRDLKAWRSADGGWFIADEVVGKHDFIPFAVAIDASGAVKDIEILEYREAFGGDVMNPKWRAQFTGKKSGANLKIGDDIANISGATLSSTHVTAGVRRLLATYAIVLAH